MSIDCGTRNYPKTTYWKNKILWDFPASKCQAFRLVPLVKTVRVCWERKSINGNALEGPWECESEGPMLSLCKMMPRKHERSLLVYPCGGLHCCNPPFFILLLPPLCMERSRQEGFACSQNDTPTHICAVAGKNPPWGGWIWLLPRAKWEMIIKRLLLPVAVHSFDRWTAVGFPTLQMRKAKRCCSAPRTSAPFVAPMESRTATSVCCVPTTCAYCVGELILRADSGSWGSWQHLFPTNSDLSCVTYVNSFGMSLGSTAWHSVA